MNLLIETIIELIQKNDIKYLPKTYFYNEGWLLRIFLNYYSKDNNYNKFLLNSFPKSSNWFSEASLRTKFNIGDKGKGVNESHTKADAVLGDFKIRNGTDTGIEIIKNKNKKLNFCIIEAKINAPLATGVTNNSQYNQLARNVACLANELSLSKITLEEIEKVSLIVLTPNAKKNESSQESFNGFYSYKESNHIKETIKNRIQDFKKFPEYNSMQKWYNEYVLELLNSKKFIVEVLSWEDIILGFGIGEFYNSVSAYYSKTLEYNNIR